MKELKQWQEVYVSDYSEECAKQDKIKRIFICMDSEENDYIVKNTYRDYSSWKYAVPVEEVEEEIEWKLWDFAVVEWDWDIEYMIINTIRLEEGTNFW